MAHELNINPAKTAVVVIDLQKGIAQMPTQPYSSETVISNTANLLNIARQKGINIFLIRVSRSPDLKDALKPISESTFQRNQFDPSWSEYVPQLNIQSTDFLITKHQWGAFYGTELDLQLRRRGIDTIILCGISTNFGVESTARFAYEFGYNQIFVEDAMSARSKEEHDASVKNIFPRLGLVRSTEDVINSFKKE
jgi:nicotinamidase-related amidase